MTRRKLYAYYYPAYHDSPSGWHEWELVREARQWFEGHEKPDEPMWGELDDSLPDTFIRQARAAQAAGIDGFVFDLWWRPDGATLYQETLDRAVLPAYASGAVPASFGLGLNWCPVWPRVALPIGMDEPSTAEGIDRLFPFTAEDLLRLVDHLRPFLTHPAAITVEGRPLLALFHGWRVPAMLGDGARAALDAMRAAAGGLFIAGCVNAATDAPALVACGMDATTSLVWWPEWLGPARQRYDDLAAARLADWEALAARQPIPHLPSVAAGWDATPRGTRDWNGERIGFPFTPVVQGNTPKAVANAVASALAFLDRRGAPADHPVMIASWNEWSESHRLEPCERWGNGYLDALAKIRR